jgi:hypothetical protein
MQDPIVIKATALEDDNEFLVVITGGPEVIDHRVKPEPTADINKLEPGVHLFDSIEDIKM